MPHQYTGALLFGRLKPNRCTQVQDSGFEIDLLPPQVHYLSRSQNMPVGQEHHQTITVSIAVRLCCFVKLVDLENALNAIPPPESLQRYRPVES
jgi:hypothetical protein